MISPKLSQFLGRRSKALKIFMNFKIEGPLVRVTDRRHLIVYSRGT
jgi:hypothetical protein